jgi:NADPH2:quinone reductase
VINYKSEAFKEEVLRHTGGDGVSMVLDCVGAPYLLDNLRCLSEDGTLVLIGLLGGARGEINLATLLTRRLKLVGSTLRSLSPERKGTLIQSFSERFSLKVPSAHLTPEIFDTFPLPEVEAAHQLVSEGGHFGKIALSLPRS